MIMKLFFLSSVLVTIASAAEEDHVLQLHGSGTTNPSKCYWSIMESLTEQAGVPIHMSYRAVGSTTGIEEFAAQFLPGVNLQNRFGSGDLPLTREVYGAINGVKGNPGTDKLFIHLPVVAGAVSFFHSVPGATDLKLTSCILSQIYTQTITSWGDSQITALNPGLSAEAKETVITVARRIKGSSSTESATKYLHEGCDDPDQKLPIELVGALPPWPENAQNMVGCAGSSGVTACVKGKAGTIGYIDSGHGLSANLEEVRLFIEESGEFKTSQESSVEAAITRDRFPESPDDDFSDVSFLNAAGENTWPIVQMTYLYVRKELPDYIESHEEQTLLIAFLRALYEDTYIKRCEIEFGFTLMTGNPEVKAFAEEAIDILSSSVNINATDWFFETDTAAIFGAEPYVFSVKRRQIADVKLDGLAVTVAALEEQLSTAGSDGNGNGNFFTEQDRTQLKAALVLSSLSFVFWMFWIGAYIYRFVKGS